MSRVQISKLVGTRRVFKAATIANNLVISGSLAWQEVIEFIEGFHEGQTHVASLYDPANFVNPSALHSSLPTP
jgi:hypothetical protein